MRKFVALIVAAIPLVLHAQQTQQTPGYGETIEVRVINVDAVVTDRSGKPVPGLTKDDFELYDNGKKRDISNFFANSEPVRPAGSMSVTSEMSPQEKQQLTMNAQPTGRRHIVVFLDNTTIRPEHRLQVMPLLTQFVNKNMRAGDDIMIAEWNTSLAVPVPFTTDKGMAMTALDRFTHEAIRGVLGDADLVRAKREIRDTLIDASMGNSSRGGNPLSADTSALDANSTTGTPQGVVSFERPLGIARIFAEDVFRKLRQKSDGLKSVLTPLSGLEGKKIVVILTESFSAAQAREILEYVDTYKSHFASGLSASPRTEATHYQDNPIIEDLAAAANASGATLYPISTLGADVPNVADASQEGPSINDTPNLLLQSKASTQVLHDLATATGGVAITGTSNFNLAFDTIANDLTQYYSIGYRAEGEKDAVHKIVVKVKKSGLTVRTREAYAQKSASSQMNDAVSANLYYPVRKNDLGIKVAASPETAAPAGERKVVPVLITIPTESLTLVPDGTDLTGKFSIYAAFFRADGMVSPVSKQQQQFRFPAESLKRRKEITVKLNVDMDRATNTVSIGVIDDVSQATGFAALQL